MFSYDLLYIFKENYITFKFIIACEQNIQSVPSKNKDDTKRCIKMC